MQNIYKPIHREAASYSLPGRILSAIRCIEEALPSQTDSPEIHQSEDFLRRNAYAVLRQLVRDRDSSHISLGLERGWFSPELCRKALADLSIQDLSIRLLLMRAGREGNEAQSISPEITAQAANLEARVKGWNFRLAAQLPEIRMILSQWKIQAAEDVLPAGSDGENFYIHPSATTLPQGRPYNFDSYLHTITHCIFRHTQPPRDTDLLLWNLAADIAAEYHRAEIFSTYSKTTIQTPLEVLLRSWSIPDFPPLPETCSVSLYYSWLLLARDRLAGDSSLSEDFSLWEILQLELEKTFCLDDHHPWYHADPGQVCRHASLWKKASDSLGQSSQGTRRGSLPGSRQEKMLIREQSQFDYRRYLRRYSTIREEMQLDLDSFDYIPYHYGMAMYGNMPMLEPLEYTETSKVEELVIAIDTSGSCDTATVRKFLEETHNILTRQENFFRRMQVHILQCDSMIHEHVIIHSTEEWMRYIQNIQILGRGGTDFTPVFTYINHLQKQGSLSHLKGLLYFTDGDGIYPREETPYETAFIFTNHRFQQYPVPPWILRLCLEPFEYCSYYSL